MAERGHWNRAARRSGGSRPLLIRAGRTDGKNDSPPTLVLDEQFMEDLIRYGDAKKAVYECQCEQGQCEHVTTMLDAARDIADRLVADPPANTGDLPRTPDFELRPHERRAADGSIHWWACRIFYRDPEKAALGCDCDTAKESTLIAMRRANDGGET